MLDSAKHWHFQIARGVPADPEIEDTMDFRLSEEQTSRIGAELPDSIDPVEMV